MTELLWTQEAVEDREAIYDYIAANNPLAALTLDESFSEKAATLVDHPGIGHPGRVTGTRELVIHRNYLLVYEVVGEQIRVLRLLRTARKWPP
jgi:addiction module RelE/StbE family toxin